MKQLKIFKKDIPFTHEHFFLQYRNIAGNHKQHILLESGRGGKYSIAAFTPEKIFIGVHNQLMVVNQAKTHFIQGNPLHILKEQLALYNIKQEVGTPGGAFGYISYDYARYIEYLPEWAKDDLQIPVLTFFLCHQWFVYDHENSQLVLYFLAEEEDDSLRNRQSFWMKQWENLAGNRKEKDEIELEPTNGQLEVSMSETEFINAVEKIQDYISKGDVFQVNLSVRQSKPLLATGLEVYEELRTLNPSPYMGYFHTEDFQLVSGSPELLVKKVGDEVSTRPIAGTRSRGKNAEDDLRLASELINNEKERAEHVMLVDLERNDLGRVCEYGSVHVNEFMVIEKYSHVMHIVSNVKGKINKNKDEFNLIDAAFPGGTITGTPKVRTMEIIEELEPVRRGPYTGSLGWIGFNGDLELNIIIRTMVVKDKKAHIQAGAGIVIDSHPKHEYKEALKKAAVLWAAKEQAESKKRSIQ